MVGVGPLVRAKRLRRFLFVAGMALLTYAVAATDGDSHDEAARSQAPPFVLSDLAGEAVALDSFRGEPVLLNFWATWCEPCRVELPELQTLSADCLAVVGIAVNSGSPEQVASFAQARGVRYPILIADRQVLADYGVDAIPRSVLVDAEGREAAHWEGAISREQVRAALRATLPSPQRC